MLVWATATKIARASAKAFVISFGVVGGLVFLAGPGIWAYQIFTWLRYGYWHAMPASAYIPTNHFAHWIYWEGVQKIILWFSEWPLAVYCIIFGIWIACGSILLFEKYFDSEG